MASGSKRQDGELAEFEDGEIKVYDNENYILSDSYFAYKWDQEQSINWRGIGSLTFDLCSGTLDIDGATTDPATSVLNHLEELAYTDLDKERNTRWISHDGRQAAKIMQCGMQYYMFAQEAMRKKIGVLQDYAQK